jgi:hypothetical protein
VAANGQHMSPIAGVCHDGFSQCLVEETFLSTGVRYREISGDGNLPLSPGCDRSKGSASDDGIVDSSGTVVVNRIGW